MIQSVTHGAGGGPLRLAIVKRDRLVSEFVRATVREIWPRTEVSSFQLGADALEALREQPAEMGIFGLTLPDMDGLDLLEIVADEKLVSRSLVLSGRRDERVQETARRLRVTGYFDTETEGGAELRRALMQVAEGRFYLNARLALGRPTAEKPLPALNRLLTTTELHVLAVIGDGSNDEQASEMLGMTAGTVHSHRQRIMRKLAVQTRTELMRLAIRRGVIRITESGVFRPGFERLLAGRKSRRGLEPGEAESRGFPPSAGAHTSGFNTRFAV